MAEIDPDVNLPDRRDWEQPEATEEAVESARAGLQQAQSERGEPDEVGASAPDSRVVIGHVSA
jgi:hypothetical protein